MGKVPHGCATTTPATRRLIQQSTEGVQTLAKRLGLTAGTVRKWRRRTSTEEAVRGPKPASTVLTPVEEAAIVLFRQHTLLPLDDCLYALQETIPHLSRSALHRCLKRQDISRLPPVDEPAAGVGKAKFKAYPLGYLHVDFAEVQTEEGKQYLFVAIDRTSKLAFAELQPQATQAIATDFLRRVLPQIPYKVHKLLTDNGIQFRNLPHYTQVGRHPFGQLCDEWGIEQRFTKPAHPWTNGQVERLNRTVKEATIKRFHYETTAQLDSHLQTFLVAYNYAKRLKRLKGLTPHEFICAEWQKNPTIFHRDPTRDPLPHTPGPYT
ncbi:IS481 family transposase [Hymenobacter sp. IS2118]|uniref:IS481 family transposase n=2 Tax=Hymenobacter sp. IS2118 TaxID=1505605 RepID=UPI00054DDAE4|nr:IS481 family transposase [Hymenobacter sp. IS2118]